VGEKKMRPIAVGTSFWRNFAMNRELNNEWETLNNEIWV
jgi:hypothetical protein